MKFTMHSHRNCEVYPLFGPIYPHFKQGCRETVYNSPLVAGFLGTSLPVVQKTVEKSTLTVYILKRYIYTNVMG